MNSRKMMLSSACQAEHFQDQPRTGAPCWCWWARTHDRCRQRRAVLFQHPTPPDWQCSTVLCGACPASLYAKVHPRVPPR